MIRKMPVYSDAKRTVVAAYVSDGAWKKAAKILGVPSVSVERGSEGYGYVVADQWRDRDRT